MIKKNVAPETPIFTGKIKEPTTFSKTFYNENEVVTNQIPTNVNDYTGYIKINGFEDTIAIEALLNEYDIDPLIIEDVFNVTQRSKIEIYNDVIFIVLKTLSHNELNESIFEYVSFILVDNIVFSINERSSNLFSSLQTRLTNEESLLRKNKSAFLLYSLIDVIIDQSMTNIKEIEEHLNELEDLALDAKLEDGKIVYTYRREINYIRNSISPFFDVISKQKLLANKAITTDVIKYYYDIFDHVYKLGEQVNLGKESLRIIYEIQMNNASMSMNRIMHTLTIFSVIFIPLSFMAGVFGMNFIQMPLLSSNYGFISFLVLCIAIIVFMMFYFKRKRFY